MNLRAQAGFTRRMGMGLRAGLGIVKLCDLESKQGNGRHRRVMSEVRDAVQKGHTLTHALAAQGGYFPPLLVQMVHAGELTGRLERILLYLADQYDHRIQVRRGFLVSIAWPVLQLGAAIFVVGLVLWLQELLGTGKTFNAAGISISFANYCLLVLITFAGLTGLGYALVRGWIPLRGLTPIVYKLPVLGPALQTIALARFSRVLSMTLDAGLDPARSMKLALRSTNNDYYFSMTDAAVGAIGKGQSLTQALEATGVFPSEYLAAVDVSEESGTDAESLDYLARDYEDKSRAAVRAIAGAISILIWLLIIGFLAWYVLRLGMNLMGVYNDALKGI
jgi:type II secretory pathway component PulF